MLWRQNHLQNGLVRRRRAVALHSLTSGLFLLFLVVYVVQAGHLSLVSAGVALLLGLGDLDGARRVVGDSKDPTDPALIFTAAQ